MKIAIFYFSAVMLLQSAFGLTPNQILSRTASIYVSNASNSVSYLNDNNFGGTSFTVSNNTWIAINLGKSFNKVFLSWNNPNYTWSDIIASAGSCKQNPSIPTNYTIQASSNSTNGNNGDWSTLATITNNTVTARGHIVDLQGKSWIKLNIASGGGTISEIEVFDLSQGGDDLWFFPGTSISANTFKGTPPAQNFADLVKNNSPAFNPAIVRGGIPCINSTQFKNDLSKYMEMAGNAKYWAIEMGTNDGYNNGNSNVSTFKTNLQNVITTLKNAGIQPVIARVIGTNQAAAGWQIHPDYLKAVDDLTTQNNLIAGPDLYTYFSASNHANELNSDGIHPNATGAATIQRLWAEKLQSIYTITESLDNSSYNELLISPNPISRDDDVYLSFEETNFSISLIDLKGTILYQKDNVIKRFTLPKFVSAGSYILQIKNEERYFNHKIVVE